jgi:hypothetical protein
MRAFGVALLGAIGSALSDTPGADIDHLSAQQHRHAEVDDEVQQHRVAATTVGCRSLGKGCSSAFYTADALSRFGVEKSTLRTLLRGGCAGGDDLRIELTERQILIPIVLKGLLPEFSVDRP